jgi:hypothetical protein
MSESASGPVWLRPAVFVDVPGMVAGFSTRIGGVSAPPFGSLNLGLSTNDDREAVLENRRRLFAEVGFGLEGLAVAGQVHGNEVASVARAGLYPGMDGLVTAAPSLLLCLSAADCAAVLLAMEDGTVVGACHAGWRGAAGGIVRVTLERMAALGATPERLRAYISPCISADRFEVGPEVAARFDKRFVRRDRGERPHVDLRACLEAQLVEGGVAPEAIEVSPLCTYSDTTTFFSHRAEQGSTGRMMGYIGRT